MTSAASSRGAPGRLRTRTVPGGPGSGANPAPASTEAAAAGSGTRTRTASVPPSSITLLGLVVCLLCAPALDAFAFGQDAAAALGVPVAWVRGLLLVVTALLTATLVSAAGAIGFVGLVLPHAARLLTGPGHRVLLPVTALIDQLYHQVEKAGGKRWDTSSLIHNLRLTD